MPKKKKTSRKVVATPEEKKNSLVLKIAGYDKAVKEIGELLDAARRTAARATNALMTVYYWEIGRRIVELEQGE